MGTGDKPGNGEKREGKRLGVVRVDCIVPIDQAEDFSLTATDTKSALNSPSLCFPKGPCGHRVQDRS